MKIAFDENIPIALVKVFQTFANEKQLKKLVGNLTIESAKDYTPQKSDVDFLPKNDVPWIKRFADSGGHIIISGNTQMKSVPHERLALVECGIVVIFFESRWNQWGFFDKCALLLHWWPVIAEQSQKARRGTFWHVPLHWTASSGGSLKAVSNKGPLELRAERQVRQKTLKKTRRKSEPQGMPPEPAGNATQGELFSEPRPKKSGG